MRLQTRPPGSWVCVIKLWVQEVTKSRWERVSIDEIGNNSFVLTSHLLTLLKAYLVPKWIARAGIISPRKPNSQWPPQPSSPSPCPPQSRQQSYWSLQLHQQSWRPPQPNCLYVVLDTLISRQPGCPTMSLHDVHLFVYFFCFPFSSSLLCVFTFVFVL